MSSISRRKMLKSTIAGTALASSGSISWAQEKAAPAEGATQRKWNIRQSVSRWCYPKMTLDELCAYGAQIGLKGVDLLEPADFETPKKYGLICTMGYVEAGTIPDALNVVANHDKIEAGLRKNVPLAAKAGVPNVITFSGNRRGMSDEEGAKNVILGLNRVKKIAEDNNVVLCLELLNSKVNHKDYMADHTAWGVAVMQEVNSPHVKLLYDIYHMQIMEGDLIATIQANIQWLGHFHTGGVPGRHELNNQQEVQWDGVMRGIVASGYKGYVAHEFVPTGDPRASLLQAVDLCDV
jgi:hydroxypyruvate isomerase